MVGMLLSAAVMVMVTGLIGRTMAIPQTFQPIGNGFVGGVTVPPGVPAVPAISVNGVNGVNAVNGVNGVTGGAAGVGQQIIAGGLPLGTAQQQQQQQHQQAATAFPTTVATPQTAPFGLPPVTGSLNVNGVGPLGVAGSQGLVAGGVGGVPPQQQQQAGLSGFLTLGRTQVQANQRFGILNRMVVQVMDGNLICESGPPIVAATAAGLGTAVGDFVLRQGESFRFHGSVAGTAGEICLARRNSVVVAEQF